MSSESLPIPENPADAWDFQDEADPVAAKPLPGYRPGGLTAVCVIAIVLGGLGVFASLSAFTMSLLGNQIQQFQQQFAAAGSPPEVQDVQAEMNAATMQIANRFRLVNIAFSLMHFAVTVSLVAGGIWALLLQEQGRRLLWAVCLVAIVFELARSVPNILMQMENAALMEEYMPRLMQAQTPGDQDAQVAEFGRMFARFSMIMGWVIFAGWLSLKLVFFAIAARYLGSPPVKAIYSG
jgi:hypothetical protein